MMKQELVSLRREIKYVVPLKKAALIRARLDHLLPRDGHCSDGPYSIRSLYFDSIRNTDFEEKLAGTDGRKKIRVRLYNGDPSLCRLELKQKSGDRQQKHSFLIDREDVRLLSQGKYGVLEKYFDSARSSRQIYGIMALGGYRPVVRIEYDRLAYVYPLYDTRITLDTNIRSSESGTDIFSPDIRGIPFPNESAVLEIKHSGKMMGFLSDMLSQFGLTQSAYSKYCFGRRVYYDFNY